MEHKGLLQRAIDADVRLSKTENGIVPLGQNAAIIRELQDREEDLAAVFSELPAGTKSCPLGFAQRGLWLNYSLNEADPADHISDVFEFSGPLNISRLEEALRLFVQRHESARAVFRTFESEPVQLILPHLDVRLDVCVESDTQSTSKEWLLRQITQPFDLEKGPLIRAALRSTGDNTHVFVLVMHHIVSDGESFRLFMQELTSFYNGGSSVQNADQPITSIYDIYRKGSVLDENHLGYWTQHLADLPAQSLPFVKSRSASAGLPARRRGARQNFTLSPELVQSLNAVCRNQRATPYMVLCATFVALLYRYSNSRSIALGTAVSTRFSQESLSTMGCFLNVAVLKLSVDSKLPFLDLVKQVRQELIGVLSNLNAPLDEIVMALRQVRNTDPGHIFQSFFEFTSIGSFDLGDLKVERQSIDPGVAQFDISLHLFEQDKAINGYLEFDTDLISPSLAERIVHHYEKLLAYFVAESSHALGAVPFLPEPELRLLEQFETGPDISTQGLELHAIAKRPSVSPDNCALTFEDKAWTYAEVDLLSDRLAHHIQRTMQGKVGIVALSIERSEQLVLTILAVWKAGCAYLPLDSQLPAARLKFMLSDTQACLLVSDNTTVSNFDWFTGSVINLDDPAEPLESAKPAPVPPHKLAYIMYTSGSTGKPKGVMVGQSQVVSFLAALAELSAMSAEDALMAVTTLSFDISVLELFLPLFVGGRVHIVGSEAVRDPRELIHELKVSACNFMQATPSTWRLMLNSGWRGGQALTILCGGEMLPQALADELLLNAGRVWNLYGPTETTVWSTAYELTAEDSRPLIGTPIANTQVYVLDDAGNRMPVGMPGEICIGGRHVAYGYVERPQLTQDRFVDNPFSENSDDKIYRTGDRGCYLENGQLEFLGRQDAQVKVRGYRIELGEIEAALNRYEGITESAAIADSTSWAETGIVAYFVAASGESISVIAVRKHLRRILPAYMIPQIIEELKDLPRLPSGKIDRKSLLPAMARGVKPELDVPDPANEFEEFLISSWIVLLDHSDLSPASNFFEAGGNSLLVLKANDMIYEKFGTRLPLQAFVLNNLRQIASEMIASSR